MKNGVIKIFFSVHGTLNHPLEFLAPVFWSCDSYFLKAADIEYFNNV